MSQKGGGENGEGGQSAAEWITLSVSVAVVLAVVGLIGYDYFASAALRMPVIEVDPVEEEVQQVNGAYYLLIEVTNRGEQTAEDVMVQVSLVPDQGQRETSQFTVAFLAGNDTEREMVVFKEDPSEGNLSSDVQSFRRP